MRNDFIYIFWIFLPLILFFFRFFFLSFLLHLHVVQCGDREWRGRRNYFLIHFFVVVVSNEIFFAPIFRGFAKILFCRKKNSFSLKNSLTVYQQIAPSSRWAKIAVRAASAGCRLSSVCAMPRVAEPAAGDDSRRRSCARSKVNVRFQYHSISAQGAFRIHSNKISRKINN